MSTSAERMRKHRKGQPDLRSVVRVLEQRVNELEARLTALERPAPRTPLDALRAQVAAVPPMPRQPPILPVVPGIEPGPYGDYEPA